MAVSPHQFNSHYAWPSLLDIFCTAQLISIKVSLRTATNVFYFWVLAPSAIFISMLISPQSQIESYGAISSTI